MSEQNFKSKGSVGIYCWHRFFKEEEALARSNKEGTKEDLDPAEKAIFYVNPGSVTMIMPRRNPNECTVFLGGTHLWACHSAKQLLEIFKVEFDLEIGDE